jgi:two-component system cell cycle sensor histidine kinase/response regulator CckA
VVLVVVFVGAASALGLVSLSARRTYRTLESAAAARQESYEFLMALRQLRQHVGEVRVGLTGYATTRDSLYRATYLTGITGLPADTVLLFKLARGEPTLVAPLGTLTQFVRDYTAEMTRQMERVNRGEREGAGNGRTPSRSALLLEGFRAAIVGLESEQKRLMDASAEDVTAAVRQSRNLITVVVAIGILVVLGAGGFLSGFVLRRELWRRVGAEEKRRRAFFSASPLPMLLYDRQSLQVIEANDAAAEAYGRTREELATLTFDRLLADGEQQRHRARLDAGKAGHRHTGLWMHRRGDGSSFEAEVSSVTIEIDGRPLELAAVHDVSQQRRMEAELRQGLKMEAVGRLATGVAHDFSNITTTLLTSLDGLLASLAGNASARAEVEIIRQAVRHSTELTRQLLLFSQHPTLEPRVVDLNALVSETLAVVGQALGPAIGIDVRLGDGPIEVLVDPAHLQKALVNLAANARDAMRSTGTFRLRTESVTLERAIKNEQGDFPAGTYARLVVEDDGFGMDAATQARAFEPFFTTKSAGKGTGLGLSTVYAIVRQSGGFIRLMSVPAAGTKFEIYLRQEKLSESRRLSPALGMPAIVVPTAPDAPDPTRPDAICVVDDDEQVRAHIARAIRFLGYYVIECADGNEALRVSETYAGRIILLVSDVVLPGVSGVSVARTMRLAHPDLPVLLVSGYADVRVAETDDRLRGAVFLKKPFDAEALQGVVKDLLEPAAV